MTSMDHIEMPQDDIGARLGMWIFIFTEIPAVWWIIPGICSHAAQVFGRFSPGIPAT